MKALQRKVGCYTTAAEDVGAEAITTFFVLDEVGARMGQVSTHVETPTFPLGVTQISFVLILIVSLETEKI